MHGDPRRRERHRECLEGEAVHASDRLQRYDLIGCGYEIDILGRTGMPMDGQRERTTDGVRDSRLVEARRECIQFRSEIQAVRHWSERIRPEG
jgi:hypothetical protein